MRIVGIPAAGERTCTLLCVPAARIGPEARLPRRAQLPHSRCLMRYGIGRWRKWSQPQALRERREGPPSSYAKTVGPLAIARERLILPDHVHVCYTSVDVDIHRRRCARPGSRISFRSSERDNREFGPLIVAAQPCICDVLLQSGVIGPNPVTRAAIPRRSTMVSYHHNRLPCALFPQTSRIPCGRFQCNADRIPPTP
jgi:hypothetical protein